ncbi:hypothetical protein [Aquimarina sp. Aq107]|uniref:hypothetical protein n=1 Tax=Aquimarina sp. Aq107 TaxID=1191912 RepID=UPI000D55FC9B|nr:hypothetical protein [Aquimarina sp. Aq107]
MFFTGTFEAIDIDNVNEAQFFANTVDTETVGMDIVLSWKWNYSFGTLSALLAGNFNHMYITAVNTDLDPDFFLAKENKAFY